MFLHMLTYK